MARDLISNKATVSREIWKYLEKLGAQSTRTVTEEEISKIEMNIKDLEKYIDAWKGIVEEMRGN